MCVCTYIMCTYMCVCESVCVCVHTYVYINCVCVCVHTYGCACSLPSHSSPASRHGCCIPVLKRLFPFSRRAHPSHQQRHRHSEAEAVVSRHGGVQEQQLLLHPEPARCGLRRRQQVMMTCRYAKDE